MRRDQCPSEPNGRGAVHVLSMSVVSSWVAIDHVPSTSAPTIAALVSRRSPPAL